VVGDPGPLADVSAMGGTVDVDPAEEFESVFLKLCKIIV